MLDSVVKAVQYVEVCLERLVFVHWGNLQGVVCFCNYAVLTAQLERLGLGILSARSFYCKPGTHTETFPGKSYPLILPQ